MKRREAGYVGQVLKVEVRLKVLVNVTHDATNSSAVHQQGRLTLHGFLSSAVSMIQVADLD